MVREDGVVRNEHDAAGDVDLALPASVLGASLLEHAFDWVVHAHDEAGLALAEDGVADVVGVEVHAGDEGRR